MAKAKKRAKKKTAKKAVKKVARKKSARKRSTASNRQTGGSNKERDEQRSAKGPGKRVVKTSHGSHTYYERRKNRSDQPGKLTGFNTSVLSRELKDRANGELAAGLLARDKATNLKQHKAAMKKITGARKKLRAFS
jgi:hypothetical protein